MADKFCWNFGPYETVPVRCKVVKETAKQIKALPPGWDNKDWGTRPRTMIKGRDCFMTYEEALIALQKSTLHEVEIRETQIDEFNDRLERFIKNKGM